MNRVQITDDSGEKWTGTLIGYKGDGKHALVKRDEDSRVVRVQVKWISDEGAAA